MARRDASNQTMKVAVVLSGSSAHDMAAAILEQLEAEAVRPTGEVRAMEAAGARITDWAGPVAGPTSLEKRFGIPRSTLHWWQRHKDVVALRKGARRHVFPLAQFIDGRPMPGMREVLSSIPNPRSAWLWLIGPSPLLKGRIPIELLKEGFSAEVASAAHAFSLIQSC
ncbi:antitoxin Xre/MbcA/ParS-like domain-containing protein [Mesorhizobium sp. Cs1321R2N1]|uniref:antitoxin Xre/MbcA/ParS-like domain-containing protein n=1 Tax=Mesorhizobium sp. Cs1321R2N1 TaxID=3015174 RepID=UPI00301CFC28